jgi:putative SOS response-associated peptidase YedK
MCGRYVITKPISKTKELVKSTIVVNEVDNYNAHPTQKLPVIKSYSNGKTLEMLQWGLTPPWVQEKNIKPLINARLETLGKKMSFKNLITSYRCLIVADGYYEWKRQENVKTPHYFTREDNQPMFFAGIYKDHQFLIVTKEASSNVANIHQRQPVIINEEDLDKYFNLKIEGTNFLKSYQTQKLKYYPVIKDVNKPTNNYKRLIEAV